MKRIFLFLSFALLAFAAKSQTDCDAQFTYSFNPLMSELLLVNASTGENLTYTWTLNGVVSTEQNPVVVLPPPVVEVCLLITSSTGCVDSTCQTVNYPGSIYCNAAINPTLFSEGNFMMPYAPFSDNYTYTWTVGQQFLVQGYELFVGSLTGTGWEQICLEVSDGSSCQVQTCDSFYFGDTIPCDASFQITPLGNPASFAFQNTITGNGPFSVFWTFGDGGQSTDNSPVHTYANGGTYQICLNISNSVGCSDSYCTSLLVDQPVADSCNASFTYIDIVSDPLTIEFSGIYPANDPNFVHLWSFGGLGTSTQASPEFQFPVAAVYSVCHTVTNTQLGCDDLFCMPVFVSACNAGFTYSGAPVNPQELVFSSSNLTGNYTYHWTFGDGTSSSLDDPSHAYPAAGTYEVCLFIVDSASECSDEYCLEITVGGNVPTCDAQFIFVDNTPIGGVVSFFSDSASEGLDHIWHFNGFLTETAPNPSIQLPEGTYDVCHIVFSPTCADTVCTQITVGSAVCNAEFTFSGDLLNGGQFQFTSVANNSTDVHIWHFGNGEVLTVANPLVNLVLGGNYTVCHTVSNSEGTCVDSMCVQIYIGNNELFNVGGLVFAGSNYADLGVVSLYSYDATSLAVEFVAETPIDSSGSYFFAGVHSGIYLIQAELSANSAYFNSYVATYFGSQFYWGDAEPVNVSATNYNYNIALIYGSNPGGNGTVGGGIDDGDQRLEEGAAPAAYATVVVTDLASLPQRWVTADANGNFNIANLAHGTYLLYADVPGIICIPIEFTLSPETPGVEISVVLGDVTSVVSTAESEISSNLFPNPASVSSYIKLNLKQAGEVTIAVNNLAGQTILSSTANVSGGIQTIEIPVSAVAAGTYIVSIRNSQNNLIGARRLTVTR